MTGEAPERRKKLPIPLSTPKAERVIQMGLTGVVAGVWVAVLWLPVSNQVQVGVQAAMMIVLGRYFGISIMKRGNGNGGSHD